MSHRRERSARRYSELEELEHKYYKELRDEKVRIRGAGKYVLCPYCRDRRTEYDLLDLERHASRIARESKSATFGDKARHLGLLKYLGLVEHRNRKSPQSLKRSHEFSNSYQDDKGKSVKSARETNLTEGNTGGRKLSCSSERTIQNINKFTDGDNASIHTTAGATQSGEIVTGMGEIAAEKGDVAVAVDNHRVEDGEIISDSADFGATAKETVKSCERVLKQESQSQHSAAVKPSTHNGDDEPIVWPWMAIIANLPVEKKDGKYAGASCRKLKEEWISQGYNPEKIHPLWNFRGHSGFAIVEFKKDWEGFKNAMAFEKAFEMSRCGKRDWHARRSKGDELYGWLAREEEYRGMGLISKHLKKHGDLKTLTDIQKEDQRKDTRLMCNLTNALESKRKECEEIKKNISKTEIFMRNIVDQKEEMIQSYNEGNI